jgi:ankyrin repeat protein
VNIVRDLIDTDADVNLKNKEGKTELQFAQEAGHGPAIEKAIKDALAVRAQRVKATEEQVMEPTGLIGDLAHIVAESVHGEGLKKES